MEIHDSLLLKSPQQPRTESVVANRSAAVEGLVKTAGRVSHSRTHPLTQLLLKFSVWTLPSASAASAMGTHCVATMKSFRTCLTGSVSPVSCETVQPSIFHRASM